MSTVDQIMELAWLVLVVRKKVPFLTFFNTTEKNCIFLIKSMLPFLVFGKDFPRGFEELTLLLATHHLCIQLTMTRTQTDEIVFFQADHKSRQMCGSPLRRVRGEPNCDGGVQRTSGGCHVRHRHIIGTVEPYSRVQVAMLPHKSVLGPNTISKTPSPNHRRHHISTSRKQNSRVRRIEEFCTFNYVTSISK